MKMEFGKIKSTELTDDNGSKVSTEEHYKDGEVVKPIRRYYEVKTRVRTQVEEHTAYINFSDEIRIDKSMLDPVWRIEHSTYGDKYGFYYVVKCFTKLEY